MAQAIIETEGAEVSNTMTAYRALIVIQWAGGLFFAWHGVRFGIIAFGFALLATVAVLLTVIAEKK